MKQAILKALSWLHVRSYLMFFFPIDYSEISFIIIIGERKDQKTLDKLRAERKAKIDELKERTNYYLTQQLIQVSENLIILLWVIFSINRLWHVSLELSIAASSLKTDKVSLISS